MDIELSDKTFAPKLTADSSNNIIGNSIDITFSDNESWRNAISEIKVGDIVLDSSKYSQTTGKITIDGSVFTAAGDYTIIIKANGFEVTSLIQTIMRTMKLLY